MCSLYTIIINKIELTFVKYSFIIYKNYYFINLKIREIYDQG